MFNGRYPQDMLDLYGPLLPEIWGSDMEAIAVPLDYLESMSIAVQSWPRAANRRRSTSNELRPGATLPTWDGRSIRNRFLRYPGLRARELSAT